MASSPPATTGRLWRDAWALARFRVTHPDWPAWRRFLLALFALSLAFFLALFSAVLNRTGRHGLGVACAALSLVLTGIIAVRDGSLAGVALAVAVAVATRAVAAIGATGSTSGAGAGARPRRDEPLAVGAADAAVGQWRRDRRPAAVPDGRLPHPAGPPAQRRRVPGHRRHRRGPHSRAECGAPAGAVPGRRRVSSPPVSPARRREVIDALRRTPTARIAKHRLPAGHQPGEHDSG